MSFALKARSGKVHPDAADDRAGSFTSTAGGAAADLSRTGSLRSTTGLSKTIIRRAGSGPLERADSLRRTAEAKGLALGDAEHAEWLAEKVRTEGRRDAKNLFRFYCRMLIPVGILTLWAFAFVATLSWSIPNRLCNRIAKENSGAVFGLPDCIYNRVGSEGGYGIRWGAKTFWVAFWMVQHAWLTLFPALIAWALFGPAFVRSQRIAILAIAALEMCIMPIAGPVFGLSVDNFGIVGGTAIGSMASVVITARTVHRYTGSPITATRWFLLWQLGSLTTIIYLFLMPMVITARASEAMGGLALSFVRVVVHPAIWAANTMAFRFVLRHLGYVPECMAAIFLCFPFIYSSLYGRFLLLQMDGAGSVIVINAVFACFDLAARLGDRACDGLALKFLYGERGRDALTALREHDDKRTAEVFASLALEAVSIFAASAIFSLGGVAVSPGVPPDHASIWVNAVVQLLTLLVFEFVGLALEGKYHSFEWARSFPTHTGRLLKFFLVMLTLGTLRLTVELLALFCPVYYPDSDRILLEQCDKPSLFQAITFSSANRFKMAGQFFNITQSATVNA